MNTDELLSALDAEIVRLTRVRALLNDVGGGPSIGRTPVSTSRSSLTPARSSEPRRRGRPKQSTNKTTSFNPEEFSPERRTMSAAGKERIAAAQRARWAKQKGIVTATKRGTATSKEAAVESKAAPAKKHEIKTLPKGVASRNRVPSRKVIAKTAPASKVTVKNIRTAAVKKSLPEKKSAAKQARAPRATPPLAPPPASVVSETNTNA